MPGARSVTVNTTGPSALAVRSRATYSALVLPLGSERVKNRKVPLSAVPAATGRTATKAKDELMTSVEYAETSNTEVAQLLAAVVERRESLEAADEILNDYVDRAEALRIKLQQLQTRSDSFAHQISVIAAKALSRAEAISFGSCIEDIKDDVIRVYGFGVFNHWG